MQHNRKSAQQTEIKSLTRLKAIDMTSVRHTHGIILNVFWYRFRMTRSTNVYSQCNCQPEQRDDFFLSNEVQTLYTTQECVCVCAFIVISLDALIHSELQIRLKSEQQTHKNSSGKEIECRMSTLQWHKYCL